MNPNPLRWALVYTAVLENTNVAGDLHKRLFTINSGLFGLLFQNAFSL